MLQTCTARFVIIGNTPEIIQLLSLLAGDIRAHVPGVGQRKQSHIIVILDVFLPLLLRLPLCFKSLNALIADLGEHVGYEINLHSHKHGAVCECGWCYMQMLALSSNTGSPNFIVSES